MRKRPTDLKHNQLGDTLVEVLLATVIMSIVVMASYALVNRATRLNQLSSERSEAVAAMQFQAETLRFYRDNKDKYPNLWDSISEEHSEGPQINRCEEYYSNGSGLELPDDGGGGSFYFDNNRERVAFNPSSKRDSKDGNFGNRYFIWVDPYLRSEGSPTEYVDFYIHSCWMGPAGTGPQKSSLIYRMTI